MTTKEFILKNVHVPNEQMLNRFAKYHVKLALEAAAKNVVILRKSSINNGEIDITVDTMFILNSYPTKNIK